MTLIKALVLFSVLMLIIGLVGLLISPILFVLVFAFAPFVRWCHRTLTRLRREEETALRAIANQGEDTYTELERIWKHDA